MVLDHEKMIIWTEWRITDRVAFLYFLIKGVYYENVHFNFFYNYNFGNITSMHYRSQK